MKREVKFVSGYNCRDFECRFDSPNCRPDSGGYHGVHGLEIVFYVKDVEGAIQFRLMTNWIPFITENKFMYGMDYKFPAPDLYPLPADLGYHSRSPFYEDQYKTESCSVLDGDTCYYDGSGLNASLAFSVLVNQSEEELWIFLEKYYNSVFRGGKFPKIGEYNKRRRNEIPRK